MPSHCPSVLLQTEPASDHGQHFWQPFEEPHWQEGDEDPDGRPGCSWENNNIIQT